MSSVCLVVPVQDEAASVGPLLRSIAALSLRPEEIVLVDAGSTDGTLEEARKSAGDLPLRTVREGRLYPGLARNRGVAETSCEWIAFTDAGITLDPGWLSELLARATPSCDVVLGNLEPVCDSFFRECSALAYVPGRTADGGRGPFIASSLVRKTAFDAVGGFPAFRAAEDLVFLDRLRRRGAVMLSAPRAIARWQIAATPAAMFRRFALYSKHNLVAGWQKHWHYGVLRLYAGLAAVCAATAAVLGGAAALAVLPAFFVGRAAKAAWRKRGSFPFSTGDPLRLLGTAGVLVFIDLATLAGFLSWVLEGRERSS